VERGGKKTQQTMATMRGENTSVFRGRTPGGTKHNGVTVNGAKQAKRPRKNKETKETKIFNFQQLLY
jgi:hypothetical protein